MTLRKFRVFDLFGNEIIVINVICATCELLVHISLSSGAHVLVKE